MYDPKGFSPYGVCRCVCHRAVLCIAYNADSEMWLISTHRRYFCVSIATMEWRRHTVTLYAHCIILCEIQFAGLEHVVWISPMGERRHWAGRDGPY
jgi:hypothetical protein